MRRLIKESLWSRTFQDDERGFRYSESKFKTAEAAVTHDFVQARWPEWDADQRVDFANAFSHKEAFSDEDAAVLAFMMDSGSDIIASTVASAVPCISNKDRAFELLVAGLGSAVQKANFFQALGALRDLRAVSILEEHFRTFNNTQGTPIDRDDVFDYVSCCASLAMLTSDPKYRQIVESFVGSHDDSISRFAKTVLKVRHGL